jgi:hypothetical protein
MKTFAKLKFWSFLIFGIIFLFLGIFSLNSEKYVNLSSMFFIVAIVQLIIFHGLLFYLYKGKIKGAIKE